MYPRVIPYLYYCDGLAAIRFLCDAFGFHERLVERREDGALMHAELTYDDGMVMLGTPEHAALLGELPVRHSSVLCYVADVDAHFAHAKASGARIVMELQTRPHGDRMYGAADPEGQEWYFASRAS